MATTDSYMAHTREIEAGLRPEAFCSENITTFTDNTDAMRSFEVEWVTSEGAARLRGRTPLMLERDRILYSNELRAQSDRHHVLYSSGARTTRDYAAHILRMSQVGRAICGRLSLNADLAEAIALGSKVGGVPFIHVGKGAVDAWVKERIGELDTGSTHPVSHAQRDAVQGALLDESGEPLPMPTWVDEIEDPSIREQVHQFLPWAAGSATASAYSSGQQSYWTLSLSPFQMIVKRPYIPQTQYGIWNHSLTPTKDTAKFSHSVSLPGESRTLQLDQSHLTHEAVVIRYADDISWVIENLSEASKADLLAGSRRDLFTSLARELAASEMPPELHTALTPAPDIGKIYTYFINDLVEKSAENLNSGKNVPSETDPAITLAATASRMLRLMKSFLLTNVFNADRLTYRNKTLEAITVTVLDVFWESRGVALTDYIQELARSEGWNREASERALTLLDKPVHRIQASVDALASMSDRQVYQLLGLEAL